MAQGSEKMHAFEKEKILKADKYIRVVEKFTPRYGGTQLSEKFYARHDAVSRDLDSNPLMREYFFKIGKRQESGPRQIFDTPVLDSHNYGWLVDKATKYDDECDLELFWKGKKVDPIMKIQNQINLGVKRERFFKMSR